MTGSDTAGGSDAGLGPTQTETDYVDVHYRIIRGIVAFAEVSPASVDNPEGAEPNMFEIALEGLGQLYGISGATSIDEISVTLSEAVSEIGPTNDRNPLEMITLPRETVEVFNTYFATFHPGVASGYEGDDDLMFDSEYRDQFDEAVETAQQAIKSE